MKHSRAKKQVDPEIVEFENALLRSLDQAARGEGRINTPDQIRARRSGPGDSTKSPPKIGATIRFDSDVLKGLKETGPGWQARVNEAMRDWLKANKR